MMVGMALLFSHTASQKAISGISQQNHRAALFWLFLERISRFLAKPTLVYIVV